MKQVEVSDLIDQLAPKVGVPADYFKKLVFQGENSAHKDDIPTNLVSPKNASGIAQLMPDNFKSLVAQGKLPQGSDIFDPITNLTGAMLIAKEGLDKYKGNQAAAAAHYNGGWRAGDSVAAGKAAPTEETRNYLKRTGFIMEAGAGRGTYIPPGTPMGETTLGTQSESTRTVKKTYGDQDPAGSLQSFMDSTAALRANLTAATTAQSGFLDAAASATEAKGAADVTQTLTAAERDARLDDYSHAILASFNATGPNNSIIAAHAARSEAIQARDALRPTIDAESAVTPWDDPLRWIVNKFTLPNLIAAHNSANSVANQKTQEIVQTQQMVDNQRRIDVAPTADLIKRIGVAKAAEQSAATTAQANLLRAQAQQVLAHDATVAMGLEQTNFNAHLSIARMLAETESITVGNSLRQGALDKEKKADADMMQTLALVNLRNAQLGLQPFTLQMWKDMDKPRKAELQQNAQSPSFGNSIGDAFNTVVASNAGTTLQTANPAAYSFFTKITNGPDFTAQKALMMQSDAFKKLPAHRQTVEILDALDEGYRKTVANKLKMNEVARMPGNATNPMLIDYAKVTQLPLLITSADAKAAERLATNPFMKDIAAMQVANPDRVYTDKDVMLSAIGKATAAMNSDPKQVRVVAQQLSDFYRQTTNAQFAAGGAFLAGMKRPDGYGLGMLSMGLEYTDPRGTTRALQMYNPADVEHFLMQTVIAQKRAARIAELGATDGIANTGLR